MGSRTLNSPESARKLARERDEAAERVAGLFRDRKSLCYYARSKMRMDPAYPTLSRLLLSEDRPILDLGCGAGIFAAYLRETGVRAPILGVDCDASKIALANERVASRYPDMEFRAMDAREVREFRGTVVGLDLLHYFSVEDRRELLRTLCEFTNGGGRLYLRNGVKDAGWRHLCTTLEEAFVRSSRWIVGGEWNFPSTEEIVTTLRENGRRVCVTPLWAGTPFSSVLFSAALPHSL